MNDKNHSAIANTQLYCSQIEWNISVLSTTIYNV
jgi:hypothetical protein